MEFQRARKHLTVTTPGDLPGTVMPLAPPDPREYKRRSSWDDLYEDVEEPPQQRPIHPVVAKGLADQWAPLIYAKVRHSFCNKMPLSVGD